MCKSNIGKVVIVCLFALFAARLAEAQENNSQDVQVTVEIAQEENAQDLVVAKVGGEDILFSDIMKIANTLNRFLKENFETSKNWRLNFVRQYIAQMALSKVAEQEGLENQEDVQFSMKRAKQGILAEQLVANKLETINVTEEDLKKYYEENKEKYQIKPRIKVDYVETTSIKNAEKILEKLAKGKTFKQAGGKKVISLDTWLQQGLDMFPGTEGISAEDRGALFELNEGQNSSIIGTKEGKFYIVCVTSKESAKDKPFSEVREQVKFEVFKNAKQSAVDDLIRNAFMKEKVVIYNDNIVKNMQTKE